MLASHLEITYSLDEFIIERVILVQSINSCCCQTYREGNSLTNKSASLSIQHPFEMDHSEWPFVVLDCLKSFYDNLLGFPKYWFVDFIICFFIIEFMYSLYNSSMRQFMIIHEEVVVFILCLVIVGQHTEQNG